MSLEHIFYLSQSIAAVAVIASLLYLARSKCVKLSVFSARRCSRDERIGPLKPLWRLRTLSSRAFSKKARRETRA